MTSTAPTFSTFAATETNNSTVTIPDDRRADFAAAASYFSANTNRHTLTAPLPDEPAAKLFAKQLRQWATEHNMSTSPVRAGNMVTWRFARVRDAGTPAGEVTVSHVTDAATDAALAAAK